MLIATCDRKELSEAISRAAQGLPGRPSKPVLAGMLLASVMSPAKNYLTLTSSDGDMTFMTSCPAEIHTGGTVLLPGRMLSEVSRYFTGQEVTLDYQKTAAELIFGRSRVTLSATGGEDYPASWHAPASHIMTDASELSAAIRAVGSAAGTTPPVLNSVVFATGEDTLTLAATNGYQMAVVSMEAAVRENPSSQVLIPPAAAERFARTTEGGTAELGWNDKIISLAAPGISVLSRQVGGEYARWERVLSALPPDSGISADTAELLTAVKMASLAEGGTGKLSLTFADGLTVAAAGESGKSSSEVALSDTAQEITFLLGGKALLDGLSACGETVSFAWTAPHKPFVMRSGELIFMIQPRREIPVNITEG